MLDYDGLAKAITEQIIEVAIIWLLIWLICGLFTTLMMIGDDRSACKRPAGENYWFAGRTYKRLHFFIIMISGPASLPWGIWAMCNWANNKRLYRHQW